MMPDELQRQRDLDITDSGYLEFLLYLCDGFSVSLARATQILHGFPPDARQGFRDIHSALAFAANISKMLWPTTTAQDHAVAKPRGKRIRALLQLNQGDPVLKSSVVLRDDLEHLDTRIDEWSATAGRNRIQFYIGDLTLFREYEAQEIFHHYDPRDRSTTFFRRAVNLTELDVSVTRVRGRAIAAKWVIENRRWIQATAVVLAPAPLGQPWPRAEVHPSPQLARDDNAP